MAQVSNPVSRGRSQVRKPAPQLSRLGIMTTPQISQKAIELIESYKLSHGLLIPDAIIAATAIMMNSELFSKNARHFEMIKELKVTKPY